ncbi:MAG: histidinol-phosphate transaminase [Pseudomonadales bacterium]|nr:histidinol-phosphate transaminase [Pseudomonadales bacterium]
MTCDYISLARKGVQALKPYQPGKPIEELQRELGLTEIVKLASNENPLGLSPKVKAMLIENLDELSRYPDGAAFDLKQALAKKLGVHAGQLTLGNGSNDVLDLIGQVFLDGSASAIYSEHAFVVYPMMVQFLGAKAIQVPAKDYSHDLDAMLAAIEINTKVIFIANPNNPTGTWLGHAELEAFLQKVPEHIIVVLDEAYAEYIAADIDYALGLKLQLQFANLIVTRTFSKAYGLAGLRVGYSVSSPEIADLINRVREPFNVNTLAQMAAVEVLGDEQYLADSIALNNKGRSQIEAALKDLGLDFIPAQGNFITFDTGTDAAKVYENLLHRGVIVRPISPYGLPQHLRVSIGLESENAAFIAALKQVI